MLVARIMGVVLMFVMAQFTSLWHLKAVILPIYCIRCAVCGCVCVCVCPPWPVSQAVQSSAGVVSLLLCLPCLPSWADIAASGADLPQATQSTPSQRAF